LDCWLVNAREVKNVPGRAKDRADAVWLAKVAERGMCRPSLVQRPKSADYATSPATGGALVQDRTREQQRVEKLLEDAQIKISAASGAACITGVPGRGFPKDHQLGVAEVQSNVLRFAAVIDSSRTPVSPLAATLQQRVTVSATDQGLNLVDHIPAVGPY